MRNSGVDLQYLLYCVQNDRFVHVFHVVPAMEEFTYLNQDSSERSDSSFESDVYIALLSEFAEIPPLDPDAP